jgi:hypothetical protein
MEVIQRMAIGALQALLFMGACWLAGFWFTAGAFFFIRGGF